MENETSDVRIEEWIVVQTAGPQFLGRLTRDDTQGWTAAEYVKQLREILSSGRPLQLDIAFEFATPTMQRPDGAVSRGAFVMPIGLAGHNVPVYVKPIAAYACAEMAESDRTAYTEFVQKGLDMQKEFRAGRTRAPTQRSGLVGI